MGTAFLFSLHLRRGAPYRRREGNRNTRRHPPHRDRQSPAVLPPVTTFRSV